MTESIAVSGALLGGALTVSRETQARLAQFEAVFRQWAPRINLVAPSTVPELRRRHIEDSAQLLLLAPEARHWLDLGSGGGFPGMVLAVLLDDHADCSVTLVESNRKKTAFLQTAAQRAAPRAKVVSDRIEAAPPLVRQPDVVTARALAALPHLLELASPWLEKGAVALFHKGRGYREEVEESRALWVFDLVVHESRVEPDSVILDIRNLARKTA